MPVRINGATSGSTTIAAPDTGSDETIVLSTALASKLDLAGGKILQIVRATDGTTRTTTSTSYVDVTGMSVTITPQKSDSAILILVFGSVYTQGTTGAGDQRGTFIVTDASNNAISGAQQMELGVSAAAGVTTSDNLAILAYATPATTSATTYKLRFKTLLSTATVGLLNGANTGQLYAIEVSA